MNSNDAYDLIVSSLDDFFFANDDMNDGLFQIIGDYLNFVHELVMEENEQDYQFDDFTENVFKVIRKAQDPDTFEEYWEEQ